MTALLRCYGMSEKRSDRTGDGEAQTDRVLVEAPAPNDGAALWKIVRDSENLDLNSSYAYLLWCRDFAETSVVARVDGRIAGFITGYVRPGVTDTLLVWQVAVDPAYQGQGVAGKLLDGLLHRVGERGVRYLETTVTADNTASNRLFTSLAERFGAPCVRSELFAAEDFPDGHDAEFLYRIGPFVIVRDHALT